MVLRKVFNVKGSIRLVAFPLMICIHLLLSAQGQGLRPLTCIGEEEYRLAKMINDYRAGQGLDTVPLSASLCRVAATHALDLALNPPSKKQCNLHSWSEKGGWSGCCYTSDHRAARCMWDKPRELTSYPGDGFEIAFHYSGTETGAEALPEMALESWKSSSGHHQVIINRGIWRDVSWKAMGIRIYQGYVLVWFGKEEDPEGRPEICAGVQD